MTNSIAAAALLGTVAMIGACSGTPNTNAPQNTQNNRVAEVRPQTESSRLPENVAAPTPGRSSAPEEVPVGSTATPSDAYRSAHTLRAKKDVEGLKKVMSKEILDFFAKIGKLQKRSLDATLLELVNKRQAPTADVRSEKITGNRAVIEFKDENGKWATMDFVNEGGGWKLTLPPKTNESKKAPANKL